MTDKQDRQRIFRAFSIGIGLFAATLGNGLTQNAFAQIHFSTYHNPLASFTIKYPSYWGITEENITGNKSEVMFADPASHTVFAVYVAKIPGVLLNEPKKELASVFAAYALGGISPRNSTGSFITNDIGGNPTNKTIFTTLLPNAGGIKGKGMALSSIRGDTVIGLMYMGDIYSYPVFLPTAQRVVNSFLLTR